MKFFLLITMLLIFTKNAQADICAFVSKKTALKAVSIIEKEHKIIHYCELCSDAKMASENVNKVSYNKIDEKNFEIMLNGKNIDLAYIYIKKSNSYDNLAFLSGCDEVKKYNIQETRNDFPIIKKTTKEDMYQKSKIDAQIVLKKCANIAFEKESLTTSDSLIALQVANDCIVEEIKKEINRGFEPKEQTEMLKNLEQSRTAIYNFYDKIYNSNKYCVAQCGTIAQIFPYEEETKLLQQMLEHLIFLNLAKNGY